MKTGPMTPYEIRLHLLELAFNILSQTARHGVDPTLVKMPTVDDVIKHAQTLNGFICTDK